MMSTGDPVAQVWSHRLVWLGAMRECLGDKTGSNGRAECCQEVAEDVLYGIVIRNASLG
jgi:hypothetical protein